MTAVSVLFSTPFRLADLRANRSPPEFIFDELVDFVSQSRLPTEGEAYCVQLPSAFFILNS